MNENNTPTAPMQGQETAVAAAISGNDQIQNDLNMRRRSIEHSDRTRRDLEMMLHARLTTKAEIDGRAEMIIAEGRDCKAAIIALETAIDALPQ